MADPSQLLLLVLGLGAFGLKAYALGDACIRPGAAYPAAGKLSKIVWVAILVAAVVLGGFRLLSLLGLPSIVAAIVYLVDVRPAIRELREGGGGGGWR